MGPICNCDCNCHQICLYWDNPVNVWVSKLLHRCDTKRVSSGLCRSIYTLIHQDRSGLQLRWIQHSLEDIWIWALASISQTTATCLYWFLTSFSASLEWSSRERQLLAKKSFLRLAVKACDRSIYRLIHCVSVRACFSRFYTFTRIASAGCTLCPESNPLISSCSVCTISSDQCNIYCQQCTRKDRTKSFRTSVTANLGDQYTVQNCDGQLTVANNDCSAALRPCPWFQWSRAGEPFVPRTLNLACHSIMSDARSVDGLDCFTGVSIPDLSLYFQLCCFTVSCLYHFWDVASSRIPGHWQMLRDYQGSSQYAFIVWGPCAGSRPWTMEFYSWWVQTEWTHHRKHVLACRCLSELWVKVVIASCDH